MVSATRFYVDWLSHRSNESFELASPSFLTKQYIMYGSDRLKKFCTTPYDSLKNDKTWGNLVRRSGRRIWKRTCEKLGHKPRSRTGAMTRDTLGKEVPVYRGGYRKSPKKTKKAKRHGSRSMKKMGSRSRYGVHKR